MVQGYTQQDCGGKSGWASYLGSRRVKGGKLFSRTIFYSNEAFLCSYPRGVANDQWAAYLPKNLSYQELKRLIEKLEGLC